MLLDARFLGHDGHFQMLLIHLNLQDSELKILPMKKYNVHKLVYFEQFNDMDNAITREKRLKKWRRSWKLKLIEENNPLWNDLWRQITH